MKKKPKPVEDTEFRVPMSDSVSSPLEQKAEVATHEQNRISPAGLDN